MSFAQRPDSGSDDEDDDDLILQPAAATATAAGAAALGAEPELEQTVIGQGGFGLMDEFEDSLDDSPEDSYELEVGSEEDEDEDEEEPLDEEEEEEEEEEATFDSRDMGSTAIEALKLAKSDSAGDYEIVATFAQPQLGDFIAFQWNVDEGGGWSIGEVTRRARGRQRAKRRRRGKHLQISHWVWWHGEEVESSHALNEGNYGDDGYAGAWVLLRKNA